MNSINEAIRKLESHGLLKTELRLGVVSSVTAYLLRVNLGYAGGICAVTLSRFTGEKGAGISSQNIFLGNSQTRHLKILGA